MQFPQATFKGMHPSFLINDVHTAIEVFTGVMVDYIVGTGQSAQILTESEHDMMYDSWRAF